MARPPTTRARPPHWPTAVNRFELGQPGQSGWVASEQSPYGVPLGIEYPACDPQALIDAGLAAMPAWQRLGPAGRTGVCLEALARINKASFEIAYTVMFTTGQGWMMAFQAGGPHAQDRGLEAVAYAWREMSFVPHEARWEKPQGKNPPIVMEKRFEIVGRGVALVIGCGTFPTWNTYPGLFAALATGNPVIVKPHPNAILPAAISVRIIREVLSENGIDPNLVTLAVTDDPKVTQALATNAAVKSIDFTGSNAFGRWLADHARQAQVYAELAGVNNVVIESTDAYKAMLKNLAFTLSLYSGQMCTTTQDIFVPAGGIETDEGHKSFDQVAADLGAAVDKLLSDAAVATAVLGAIQSPDTLKRIEEAPKLADVVLASRRIDHPEFPKADVRTPVLLKADPSRESAYLQERFGPISFVVKVPDAMAAVALSERTVQGTRRVDRGSLLDEPGRHRRDDRGNAARRRVAVDQPDRQRLRQSVGGVLRLSRDRRESGRDGELHRFRLRREPLSRYPATLAYSGVDASGVRDGFGIARAPSAI